MKEELEDDKLFFATANAESIDSLEKYRGRSEPYFLLYGVSYYVLTIFQGQSLVAVVKGANCPQIRQVITDMLKQEHEVMAGEIVRMEIEDTYLKVVEEEKAAEARRLARQRGRHLIFICNCVTEIDQECVPLIFHRDQTEDTVGSIIETVRHTFTNIGFI